MKKNKNKSTFIFDPNGVYRCSCNTYKEWDLLMAALEKQPGHKTIQFMGSSVTIPAGGPYCMTGVEWYANRAFSEGNTYVTINVDEGVRFKNLRRFRGDIKIDVRAFSTIPDTSLIDGDSIRFTENAQIEREYPGAVPLWSASGLTAGDKINLLLADNTAWLGPGPLIDLPIAGTMLKVNLNSNATFESDTVSGVAGTTLFSIPVSSSGTLDANQPAFSGSFFDYPLTNVRMLPDQGLSTGNATLSRNQVGRFDTSSSPISVSLPEAKGLRGQFMGVTNENGGNDVTVIPNGTDKVDNNSSFAIAPGKAALLICDGISNWIVIAER